MAEESTIFEVHQMRRGGLGVGLAWDGAGVGRGLRLLWGGAP